VVLVAPGFQPRAALLRMLVPVVVLLGRLRLPPVADDPMRPGRPSPRLPRPRLTSPEADNLPSSWRAASWAPCP
jgi:hypothetical protein